MHAKNREMWITARAILNRGWVARPKHAHAGRHASTATRRGRKIANRYAN